MVCNWSKERQMINTLFTNKLWKVSLVVSLKWFVAYEAVTKPRNIKQKHCNSSDTVLVFFFLLQTLVMSVKTLVPGIQFQDSDKDSDPGSRFHDADRNFRLKNSDSGNRFQDQDPDTRFQDPDSGIWFRYYLELDPLGSGVMCPIPCTESKLLHCLCSSFSNPITALSAINQFRNIMKTKLERY